MELKGRTALVTGATGGLGQAIARALHASGADLVLTGRRGDVLVALATELGARTVNVDLASPGAVDVIVAQAGDVDLLVANAGLSASGALHTFSSDEIREAIAVNLTAPLLLARALTPAMAQRGRGHVVFVSSLSGMTGQPGSTLYSATKFGLRGSAQGLRAELRLRGVGVSCVMPGFVREAGMFHDSGARAPAMLGTSHPDEVAAAVLDAVEHDRGEVLVATRRAKALTRFAATAPGPAARLARLVGGDRITAAIIGDLSGGSRSR